MTVEHSAAAWFRITVHRTESEGAVAGVDGFCAEMEVLILSDSAGN